eukprot:Nitzschia sp. Nitz4//scaffold29_size155292//40932//43893//NITZ4_002646-RA/size155292-augustus-gene-0.223-mRNA-1//-1//CDS//3329546412//612//frame0
METSKLLLQALESDFEADGQLSCRDCLRSKAMPCRQVEHVSQQSTFVTPDVLLGAHSALLQDALTSLQTEKSALSKIKTVATILRFGQLLLSLASSKDASAKTPPLSLEDLDQLVARLFTSLTKSLISLLSSPMDETIDDPWTVDASTTEDLRPVLSFAVSSLLRLQPLCQVRQSWMVPLCKSFCEIIVAADAAGQPLPFYLIDDANSKLAALVQEGARVMILHGATWMDSKTLAIPVETHAVLARFVVFLVTRMMTLARLGSANSSIALSTAVPWRVLLMLRGLPLIISLLSLTMTDSQENTAIFSTYHSMATKIEKQLVKVMSIKGELDTLLFTELVRVKPPKMKQANCTARIHRNSFLVGRVQLLQSLLKDLANRSSSPLGNPDGAIRLCEYCHSVALPQCFEFLAWNLCTTPQNQISPLDALVVDTIPQMVSVMVLVERSFADETKRAQWYRLIVSWLSSRKSVATNLDKSPHPFTREICQLLLYFFVLSEHLKQNPCALLGWMVKLALEPRTNVELRQNLVTVLFWLERSANSEVVDDIHKLVRDGLVRIWQPKTNGKKRKRDQQVSQPNRFSPMDLAVLGRLLRFGPTFITKRPDSWLQKPLSRGVWYRTSRAIRLSLFLSSLLNVSSWDAKNMEGVLGTSMQAFHKNLTATLVSAVQLLPRLQERESRGVLLVCLSYMKLCYALCSTPQQAHTLPSVNLCRLLSLVLSKPFAEDVLQGRPSAAQMSTLKLLIVLQAIGLLGAVGGILRSDTPVEMLQNMREIFLGLFASEQRYLLEATASALAQFGRSVPQCHASHLPTFLPKQKVAFFQARSQGRLWDGTRSLEVNQVRSSFVSIESLDRQIVSRDGDKALFPSLTAYHIVPGSYFLQMPTNEGRTALVVFPPGEASLQDIKVMYEVQAGESPPIQCLQRMETSRTLDGSCKCIVTNDIK